jgi:DNA-binding response OmpR family regulator
MRILVVEDDHALAEVLAEGLRDQGMAVDLAHDGLTAAAKLDLTAHDVVVWTEISPACTATPCAR